jgi:hypothetical protein
MAHNSTAALPPGPSFPTGNQAEKTHNPTSTGWTTTAIVVGMIAVLGGIFGVLGLLQSHYHFLPESFDWLKTAIRYIDTSHHWSLWALTAVGVLGVVAVVVGIVKMYQPKMEDNLYTDEATENQQSGRPPSEPDAPKIGSLTRRQEVEAMVRASEIKGRNKHGELIISREGHDRLQYEQGVKSHYHPMNAFRNTDIVITSEGELGDRYDSMSSSSDCESDSMSSSSDFESDL